MADRARADGNANQRRRDLRNQTFPNAADEIFNVESRNASGYGRIPKTVPLLASLIDRISGNHAGRLYITLWFHDYGQGFVQIDDPRNILFESGVTSMDRAGRNWQERMIALTEYTYIKTQPRMQTPHGFVLLRHPILVRNYIHENRARIAPLFASNPARLEDWFRSFDTRCREVARRGKTQTNEDDE